MIEVGQDTIDKLENEWRPNPRQEDFFSIPDSVFEALYGGALGGGKSEVILMLPIIKRYYTHPLFHGILFRRTYPQLEESLIMRALDSKHYGPLMSAGLCKYDATNHVFKFKSQTGDFNGAKIRFSYMEHDQDARDHKTAQYHYVGIDEASEFSPYQLTYISTRIRTETKDLPTIYRLASNPGGPSHAYLRDRFIKPEPNGNTILRDKVTNQLRIYIPAKLQDNPVLAENDPNYINRLNILKVTSPDEYKALAEGDWFTFTGQVFTEFRDLRRETEPENACHVVTPFNIPEWWPKILSIDWGYDANTVAHLAAIDPKDRLFIYKEYVRKQVPVSTWAADIKLMCQYEKNIKRVYLDGSAWNNIGNEKTIVAQFMEHSGLTPLKAEKDRVSGKMLIHDYLRWTQRPPRQVPAEGYDPDLAERIIRVQGLEAFAQYRALFEPEAPEENLPKLQIFNTCTDIIETIKLCQYPDKPKSGKPIEDVKEFSGDDSYDNLRYLLKGTGSYYLECQEENEKRRKLGDILQDLQKTNDFTSYAHRVKNIEQDNSPGPVYRRRRYAGFH